jgi:hypothetical protein
VTVLAIGDPRTKIAVYDPRPQYLSGPCSSGRVGCALQLADADLGQIRHDRRPPTVRPRDDLGRLLGA